MTILAPFLAVVGILVGLGSAYIFIKRKKNLLIQRAMVDMADLIKTHMSEGDDQPEKAGDTRNGGKGGLPSPVPASNTLENEEVKNE